MKIARTQTPVGIVSTAYCLPPRKMFVKDVFKEEGLEFDLAIANQIGMNHVHVFEGKWSSQLALEAAKECLFKAGLNADEIDVVVDFSVLPQDYVVPSWCMSNKIQHELGAGKAFNLGFGGGGTTNLLTALKFVVSLIRTEKVNTALLISTDVALPGNRVINQDAPLTVLGDGASALIVSKDTRVCEILNIELWSDGRQNDVLCIPGGGLAHPDRLDLYRLRIDAGGYSEESSLRNLKSLTERAAEKAGINLDDVTIFINPNISAKDRGKFSEEFGLSEDNSFVENRRQYGHIQGTDFVINLSQMINARREGQHNLAAVCSHGWGFSYGAMIVRI
ncbi:MAG TPA: 3-oxoacyl-[acyl-carrier-protein] synthase III C-terminal domain-containing protein [Chryseolinea sp.]|nr:3-oxoacyl-[acyl-carrier-protein] synthase III C-terminal domain-containing protein [Chryseolinea sp.]